MPAFKAFESFSQRVKPLTLHSEDKINSANRWLRTQFEFFFFVSQARIAVFGVYERTTFTTFSGCRLFLMRFLSNFHLTVL